MKPISLLSLALGSILFLASAHAWAGPEPSYLKVTSPDRPYVGTRGSLQETKVLRWDSSRQMLMADVQYTTGFTADYTVNPVESNHYLLAFPNVQLASNGTDLVATNRRGESAVIGRKEDTLFGQRIVLNPGVDFKIHRVSGIIHASITYNAKIAEEVAVENSQP